MNSSAARIGIYLILSVLAVAAVAGSLALSRRADPITDPPENALWGASAG